MTIPRQKLIRNKTSDFDEIFAKNKQQSKLLKGSASFGSMLGGRIRPPYIIINSEAPRPISTQ